MKKINWLLLLYLSLCKNWIFNITWFCSVRVITLDFESNNPGSNPGRTWSKKKKKKFFLMQIECNQTFNLICFFSFINFFQQFNRQEICVDSSMVRIRAFQAWGPGSIPGPRTYFFFFFSFTQTYSYSCDKKKFHCSLPLWGSNPRPLD